MDDTAFLSAIASVPEDNTSRLVFADWLEDRDDFRAEFVRSALKYHSTPPYVAERFKLADRLRNLLDSSAFRSWLPTLTAFKWGWRRGLLSLTIDLSYLNFELPSETTSWLTSNWIERVEFTDFLSSEYAWEDNVDLVRNTRELHFANDNEQRHVPVGYLRRLPHLRELSLADANAPWSDFATLPCLRTLVLDEPYFPKDSELHAARLPELEVLHLNNVWADDLPHCGECFPKLRSLSLNLIDTYTDEHVERFAECIQLRHLALSGRFHPLTRVGLKALTLTKDLRSLWLGPWPCGTIEGLADLAKLEHLVGTGSVKRIRGLEALSGLRWLSLRTRSQGDGILKRTATAQLAGLPQLARLDVVCDSFESGAFDSLENVPGLQMLTVDFKSDYDLPFPPMDELGRLRNLAYLRFWPRKLSPANLASLQAALPTCRIDNGEQSTEDDYDWG